MKTNKTIINKIFLFLMIMVVWLGALLFTNTLYVYGAQEEHNHNDFLEIEELPVSAGSYVLKNDILLTSTWSVPEGETNLCLNGHVIYTNGVNFSAITIGNGSTLNLHDCGTISHNGYVDSTGTWIYDPTNEHELLSNECSKSIVGGIITGGNASQGGGIYCQGTLNMYSGTISGCQSTDGGGVFVSSTGIFNMYNGTISHNKAVNCGGGIDVLGTFNMYGGVIEHNSVNPKETDTYFGGGGITIYGSGKGTLSGGIIQFNSSKVKGGGILLLEKGNVAQTVSLVGVAINNNTASTGGGGVYFDNSYVTIEFGGNTNITGNTLGGNIVKTETGYSLNGGTKNNFDFARGIKAHLGEESYLPNEMSVGISNTNAKITNATEKDVKYFSSDNEGYLVQCNTEIEDNKYLEIKKITIADILNMCPNFPVSHPDGIKNESEKSAVYLYNNSLFIQEINSYTSLINLPLTTELTKNGDDYVVTLDRTITFSVSSNALNSITVSGSDYLSGTYLVPHYHGNWDLSSNNNVLTATCGNGGCSETPYSVTLTLSAPTSLVYDNTQKKFNFLDGEEALWMDAGIDLPTIVYYIKQTGQTEYMLLLDIPRDAGNYMAEITVNDISIQVQFTIEKATPYIKTNPSPSDIELGQNLSNSTLFGGYCTISSTNDAEVAGLFEWEDENIIPELGDSEKTLYNVIFTPADEDNYNTSSSKVMLRVNHTHSYIKVQGEAPTDTTSGWKDYYSCICHNLSENIEGTVLIENLSNWKEEGGNGYIAPLGHNLNKVSGEPSTCTLDGYKDAYFCDSCNKYFKDIDGTSLIGDETSYEAWKLADGKVPKIDHDMVHHEAIAPTCTVDGTVEYWTCSYENGVYYGNIEGTETLTSIIVPMLNHHYSGDVTYTWNNDKCTASWHCDYEGCNEKEEETVTGIYVLDTKATRKNNELGHYEATFSNLNFEKQSSEINSVEKENTMLAGLSGFVITSITIGSILVLLLIAYVSMFFYWKAKDKAFKFLISSYKWINKTIFKK